MNVLLEGYKNKNFLSEKLKKIFQKIGSDVDVALHNDMMDDIVKMIGNENAAEFRQEVAMLILKLGVKKDGEEESKSS